ncbi:hypothetical protein [Paenibacillus tengchongensis]|uniref:hypothetical protein n=1 Tax=Paenibacillus tengchongensis TaxID=2608684 RepID=UPI00124C1C24|nr:hypothetical protein [Paenibacillus tengchongensis]
MKVIELAIVLSEDGPQGRVEACDLVALPFIPRKDELILWNGKLYVVTNVMYYFNTDPADYNYDASPLTQSSVAHDIAYKVWLKSAR